MFGCSCTSIYRPSIAPRIHGNAWLRSLTTAARGELPADDVAVALKLMLSIGITCP